MGITPLTRADTVVVREFSRTVAPSPESAWSPVAPSIFASGPVALVTPNTEFAEYLALDWREVLVLPFEVADALSDTTIVTRSSTRLARVSRARSVRTAPGCQIEPVGLEFAALARAFA